MSFFTTSIRQPLREVVYHMMDHEPDGAVWTLVVVPPIQ